MTKNVFIYNPKRSIDTKQGDFVVLPAFWSQAKTYYELNVGGDWNWVTPIIDMYGYRDLDFVKDYIAKNKPDIFGISLYVWNAGLCHEIAAWVKQQWPHCIVISGGPHQYVKNDINWFRDHPYLDASLPGDCYGEWCMAQIMQQLDTGAIDWNLIDNVYVPQGKSRIPYQRSSDSREIKKQFNYDWPSYAKQKSHLHEFLNHAKATKVKIVLSANFETTRGCPYGCTFCDWGGGINSKVKAKDISYVQQDIEVLADLGIEDLFLSDANFGIMGDRDIEVMKLIRADHKNNHKFRITFGGLAKTNKRLDTLKTIMHMIDDDTHEKMFVKLGIQSFDLEVLKNIQRTNITLEEYFQIYDLENTVNPNASVLVEMILGLPGMTLDKFYHELDILYRHNLNARWFEWHLLPEAPASDPTYVEKFKLGTVKKNYGWLNKQPKSDLCVVVSSYSYTEQDYLEMLLAQSWYFCIVHGGILGDCLSSLQTEKKIGYIIKKLITHSDLIDRYSPDWQKILNDSNIPALVTVPGKNEPPPFNDEIYIGDLIQTLWFWNSDIIAQSTKDCLLELGCDKQVIDKDINNIVNYKDNPTRWADIMSAVGIKKFKKNYLMLKVI